MSLSVYDDVNTLWTFVFGKISIAVLLNSLITE